MTIVIPICQKDVEAAIRNLTWVQQLNPTPQPFTCYISRERSFTRGVGQVHELARRCFVEVKDLTYNSYRGRPQWPAPQNYAFACCALHMVKLPERQPWLWWEQDAVLLKTDGLTEIAIEYSACGNPFMGTHGISDNPAAAIHLNGVAVYPADACRFAPILIRPGNLPFDVAGGQSVMRNARISPLFQHVWSWHGPTSQVPPTFTTDEDIAKISPEAVMFHRCKDGSLIDRLSGGSAMLTDARVSSGKRSFYHSGDLGDTVYSLLAAKHLGGGEFFIGPDDKSGMRTREIMNPARANSIIPLIEAQPYISRCAYSHRNPGVTHDLGMGRSEMRIRPRIDCEPGMNLARVILKHFRLPFELDTDPWLSTPEVLRVAPVIFARSKRYRVDGFNWKLLVDFYRKECAFVGTKPEYEDFINRFGHVPYYKTDDLLRLASAIAGCDLFVGNQSCPYSIAIGLGKANILEHNDSVPNCIFDRTNVRLGTDGLSAYDLRLSDPPPVVVTCPLENFTGYGQLVCQLSSGLIARHHAISVNPFSMDESRVLVPNEIKGCLHKHTSSRQAGLLVCAILEVPERLRKRDVLLTMWESTRLSDEMVTAINQKAACVIVPTHWGASCFSASGVTVPIRVAPLGVDPKVYHYTKPHRDRVFRFGTAGRLAHGGARKGVEETVATFLQTFPIEQDVQLHVKIFEDCKLEKQPDPRVIYYRCYLSQAEMTAWYERLNVFVSLTKGEGWGLHIHQSMAMGRPCIVPRASGQSEFVTEDNSLCCRFTWEDPDWSVYKGYGQWCVADQQHCSELMRHAYEHRADCEELGRWASKCVEPYTWGRFVDSVADILKEFKLL